MKFRYGCLLVLILSISGGAWSAETSWARVRLQPEPPPPGLFARVVSSSPTHVTAGLNGRLVDLKVKPGDTVSAGQEIARIAGPAVQARIQAANHRVQRDRARVRSASSLLRIARREQHRQLATQGDLLQAEARLSEARSDLAIDRAERMGLASGSRLNAPFAGTVTALRAAGGDYVTAGQVLIELAPSTGLRLSARVYGNDARLIEPGRTGHFQDDDGAGIVPVKVISKAPDPKSPGVRRLYLAPLSPSQPAPWSLGDSGTLTLDAQAPALPSVPTAALIMDRGHWWVMLKTPSGARAVRVTPVARANGRAWISQGLYAGQRVQLGGAYQDFHRDFAKHYANPD